MAGYADGGTFGVGAGSGSTTAFAQGGVVTSATPFRFAAGGTMRNGVMGEAGPEAIMPLKRGADGKLGVVAQRAGGGDTYVNVTVNNSSGETQADASDARSRELGKAIVTAVRQELLNQRRPGGLLAA